MLMRKWMSNQGQSPSWSHKYYPEGKDKIKMSRKKKNWKHKKEIVNPAEFMTRKKNHQEQFILFK